MRLAGWLIVLAVCACGPGLDAPVEPELPAGQALPAGEALYVRHGCHVCHGPEGRGDGPVAPTLDPPARDLRDPSTYRVGASEDEIAYTIEYGILVFGGSGMLPYGHIPAEDRMELARYIVSLQDPSAGRPAPAD